MGRLATVVLGLLGGCGRVGFDATHTPDGLADDALGGEAGAPRWSLVQTASRSDGLVTLAAASGAGNLIVVAAHVGNQGSVQAISDDAGNVYTAIPAARATNTSPPDALELWYSAGSRPGATTITVASSSVIVGAAAWEAAGIRAVNPLDVAATLDDQPASTTPLGPPITTSAPGELVIAVAIVANGVSGIHAGNEFINDHRTRGNGWAHIGDPDAPAGTHQAQWDQTIAGAYCATAAAFAPGP